MTKAIAYYRVSTAKQGASGLGLDAQRASVEALCSARGWEIVAPPYTEVESGKRNDRPALAQAIARAQLTGARLVIAKLDRLSRNAAFLLTLRDSGVDFVAADMPDANALTVGIMALVAQQEREAISQRTKEALAAAKARGQRLGNPNGAAALRRAGKGAAAATAAVIRNADEHAERLRPVIADLHARGITSLGGVAAALNEAGMRTPRAAQWHASSVRNLMARLAA
ncbi:MULTISPECIES: recombinase family protein [unclassified Sphingomonas]|uniref:recombinase family protein n=1 Tax=unclassified Sphingomonas TaxID=196159 RepID=UPI002269BD43|nr:MULTISPECIES: recombinase family protein [unclassified Sphingomonas]